MPNLINTDNAGNVFYNYITPVVKGESGVSSIANPGLQLFFNTWQTSGAGTYAISSDVWTNNVYDIIFNSSLETITGNVASNLYRFRLGDFAGTKWPAYANYVNASNGNSVVNASLGLPDFSTNSSSIMFMVANNQAIVHAVFTSTFVLSRFTYVGWLREPSYVGSVSPRGLIAIGKSPTNLFAKRINNENVATLVDLSTAADAITSPPIVCTAGTDPGDGSETFTDIVIRDAAAPNNPVGKLWNCIDMPATCNVGELWRNTGAHDGDASASEQDTYLCVMPWGTRKLGMRVWTENVV